MSYNTVIDNEELKEEENIEIGCRIIYRLGEHFKYNDKCLICIHSSKECSKEMKENPNIKYMLESGFNRIIIYHPKKFKDLEEPVKNQISCGIIIGTGEHLKYDGNCLLCKKFGNLTKEDFN